MGILKMFFPIILLIIGGMVPLLHPRIDNYNNYFPGIWKALIKRDAYSIYAYLGVAITSSGLLVLWIVYFK